MSLSKRDARQFIQYAIVSFLFSDLPSGTFVPLVQLPPGAVEVEGFVDVETASDAGTSDVLDVGTSGTPAGYANDINFKTANARTALTLTKGRASARREIGITRTAVGTAATAGAGVLVVGYVQAGVMHEGYGTLDTGPAS